MGRTEKKPIVESQPEDAESNKGVVSGAASRTQGNYHPIRLHASPNPLLTLSSCPSVRSYDHASDLIRGATGGGGRGAVER